MMMKPLRRTRAVAHKLMVEISPFALCTDHEVEAEISLGGVDLRAMKLPLMCLFYHAQVYKAVQASAFPKLRNSSILITHAEKWASTIRRACPAKTQV